MQKYSLIRHQLSTSHQKAVSGDASADIFSPSDEDFARVLDNPDSVTEGCKRTKHIAMCWCLQEAKLDMERKHIKTAASSCLSQDARKGSMLARVSSSNLAMDNMRFPWAW